MTQFVTKAMPIDCFDGNYIKSKSRHATSYLWPQGCTHTHTHQHESDFKKPGVCLV